MFKRLDYLEYGILSGGKLPRAARLLLGEAFGSGIRGEMWGQKEEVVVDGRILPRITQSWETSH